MNSVVKWGFRIIGIVALLLLIAGLVIYYMLSRSLPDYSRSFTSPSGDYSVEIYRDRYAVPHIYGETLEQALFGLGVAHAQDRLWQMSMMRRTAQGRISEIAGEDTVDLDLFLRALDLSGNAAKTYQNLSPESQMLLNAYADGVNAYVAHINEAQSGAGSPEFLLIDNSFAPWTAQDSVAIVKLMALMLSSGAQDEVKRTKLLSRLGAEGYQEFFYDASLPKLQFSGLSGHDLRTTPHPSEIAKRLTPTGYGREAGASNAFIAAPERSNSLQAILASDPHLKFTAPAIWFLAHLHTESDATSQGGQDWVGGTIPGIPSVIIGHSRDLAWALTTANLDDQDLIILRESQDGQGYIIGDETRPLDLETTYITVKGEDAPRAYPLMRSEFGPVLPPRNPWGTDAILPDGHLMAIAWTALDTNDQTVDASFGLMQAKTVEDGIAALGQHGAPAQVFSLADMQGNIGQVAAGKMPIRNAENPSFGATPSPSWDESAGFSGYFDYALNPRILNPEEGVLFHTNNRIIERAYPEHYSFDWGDQYRMRRAEAKLNARKIHSVESFAEAQNDAISEDARTLLPLMASSLWFQPELTGQKSEALKLLGDWNGNFNAQGPEALIYSTWITELYALIFSDELGKDFPDFDAVDPYRIELAFTHSDGLGKWCDIRPTPEIETCKELAENALDRALARLNEAFGDDMNTWRWGRAHRVIHENETLGTIPVVSLFANIIQDADGGNETLLRNKSRSENPFDFTSVHGASLRMIVNFADLNHSQFVISTGQSGNILSRHYDDFSTLWSTGQYIEIPIDLEVIKSNVEGEMSVRSPSQLDVEAQGEASE